MTRNCLSDDGQGPTKEMDWGAVEVTGSVDEIRRRGNNNGD